MPLPRTDDFVLVRYVLGWLPDDQAERLDQASIEDDEVADRLRLVEQDLIDGYVRRTLSAETQVRFESHFLLSPQRRHRVRTAEAFLRAVDCAVVRADAASVHNSGVAIAWTLPLAAAGVLILVTALPLGVTFGTQATTAPLQQPHSLHASAPMRLASTPIALILPPQTQAVGALPAMPAPSASNPVSFVLQMDADEFSQYQIALKDPEANGVLWRGPWSQATTVAGMSSVEIVIPGGLLKPQHYRLELRGRRDGGSEVISSYVFQILPP